MSASVAYGHMRSERPVSQQHSLNTSQCGSQGHKVSQACYERNRQLLRTHLPVLQALTELNEELIKQMRDAGVTAAMAEGLTKAGAEKKVQLGSGFIHDAAYLPPSRMKVILGLVHTLHLYVACRKPCKTDILAEAPIDVWYIDQFADKVQPVQVTDDVGASKVMTTALLAEQPVNTGTTRRLPALIMGELLSTDYTAAPVVRILRWVVETWDGWQTVKVAIIKGCH
eukprot:gene11985-12129_t